MPTTIQELRTVGEIAKGFSLPFWRITHILRAHPEITPADRVGTYRLFDSAAVASIKRELDTIAAKREAAAVT